MVIEVPFFNVGGELRALLSLSCNSIEVMATKNFVKRPRLADVLLVLLERTKSLTQTFSIEMGFHRYEVLKQSTAYVSHLAGVIPIGPCMHGLQQKAGRWMVDCISTIKNPNFSFDIYLADYRQTAEVIESL